MSRSPVKTSGGVKGERVERGRLCVVAGRRWARERRWEGEERNLMEPGWKEEKRDG